MLLPSLYYNFKNLLLHLCKVVADYSLIFSELKSKKIFITGHTGFKGAWLTAILLRAGATVAGYSSIDNENNLLFNELGLQDKITHFDGDICNYHQLSCALNESEPDIVFHLAAQAIVKTSFNDPVDTIQTNVLGSTHLLEAVRNCKSVKSLVFITSDKCYYNKEWVWGYRENDVLGGKDPYSASKAAAELIFASYVDSFYCDRKDLGSASVRAGNVIGGGDWSQHRLIPIV